MLQLTQLSGFGGGGGPTASAYVDKAESATSSITIPATARAGDVAVLYDVARSSSSAPSLVTPPGWANKINDTITVTRFAVCIKVLTGDDPGATIAGMSGDAQNEKMIVVFRPNAPISAMVASTFTHEFTNSAPSPQLIAASGAQPPVIVLGGVGGTGLASAFSAASPAFDAQVTASNNLRVGYKLYNSGAVPANHTIGANDLGSRTSLWGGYLTLS